MSLHDPHVPIVLKDIFYFLPDICISRTDKSAFKFLHFFPLASVCSSGLEEFQRTFVLKSLRNSSFIEAFERSRFFAG
jgi:hypothetical protein